MPDDLSEQSIGDAWRASTALSGPPAGLRDRVMLMQQLLSRDPPPREPGAYLLMASGGGETSWRRVTEGTTIGRADNADIRLPHPSVSAAHCRIGRDDRDWQVLDLGSTNGTYVNEQRKREHYLCRGDMIQVGRFVLLFFIVDP